MVETGYGRAHIQNNPFLRWLVTAEGRRQFMADLVNTVHKSPRGISAMHREPEQDAWNADRTPGPGGFTMDKLTTLGENPDSYRTPAGKP